jgi:hypothetical protein
MTTQNDKTDQVTSGGVSMPGWLATLRQRIAAVLAWPSRLWARFINRLTTTWRFVNANKLRLFLTIVLVATVIGTVAALYLWRREIADLLATVINMAIARIRDSRLFRKERDVVIIGKAMSANGVQSPVRKVLGDPGPLRE